MANATKPRPKAKHLPRPKPMSQIERAIEARDMSKLIADAGIDFGFAMGPLAGKSVEIASIERRMAQLGRDLAELADKLQKRAMADAPLPLFDEAEPLVGDVVRSVSTTRPKAVES